MLERSERRLKELAKEVPTTKEEQGGHDAKVKKHQPSALVNARLRKVQEALAPNAPHDSQDDLETLPALLAKLPREKIAALLDSSLDPNASWE
jgi:hypothetical protein